MRALHAFAGILLLPSTLLFLACGSHGSGPGGADGSCDTRSVNGACEDYTGAADVVAAYKAACTQGTWKDTGCDRTGSVGGCEETAMGLTITNWFYPPMTTSMVQQNCAPSMFVSP
jgi:hypothetical protein